MIWVVESRSHALGEWIVIEWHLTEDGANKHVLELNTKFPDRQRRICKYDRVTETVSGSP